MMTSANWAPTCVMSLLFVEINSEVMSVIAKKDIMAMDFLVQARVVLAKVLS